MTAQDVITQARIRLNDTTSSAYRFSDEELRQALMLAERELFSARPDYAMGDDDDKFTIAAPVPITRNDDPLSSADKFLECLMHGILAIVFSDDTDEHESNPGGKAAFHRARFELMKATT